MNGETPRFFCGVGLGVNTACGRVMMYDNLTNYLPDSPSQSKSAKTWLSHGFKDYFARFSCVWEWFYPPLSARKTNYHSPQIVLFVATASAPQTKCHSVRNTAVVWGNIEESWAHTLNCHVERNDSQSDSELTEDRSKQFSVWSLITTSIPSSCPTSPHLFTQKCLILWVFEFQSLVVDGWNLLVGGVLWWSSCCTPHTETEISHAFLLCVVRLW